jgi:hypothetical protein
VPARLSCSLASRYGNPMPESTISPRQGLRIFGYRIKTTSDINALTFVQKLTQISYNRLSSNFPTDSSVREAKAHGSNQWIDRILIPRSGSAFISTSPNIKMNYRYFYPQNFNIISKIVNEIMIPVTLMRKIKECKLALL